VSVHGVAADANTQPIEVGDPTRLDLPTTALPVGRAPVVPDARPVACLVFTADGQLARAELVEGRAEAVCDYIGGYMIKVPVTRDSRDAPPIAADVAQRAQAALHLPLTTRPVAA
jgi:hypothetical protein